MTQTKALKLALEALKVAEHFVEEYAASKYYYAHVVAIAAAEEALAQPEQEPVGQLLEDAFGRGQVMWFNKPKDESMLYTTPPQRTLVGLTDEQIQDVMTKAVRAGEVSWVGYKEDELGRCTIPSLSPYHFQIVRAIEAAHGIKE